jgi:hypothetical protein
MRTLFKWSFFLIVLLAVLAVMLLSASIYTFHQLTDETQIAELRFDRTGDRQYIARLRTGDGCEERVLPVLGDQWRVDAEFLKWKYWALLFGLDSQYRLDRLEGRYRSTAEQNSAPNIAHDLAGGTALDLVSVAGALGALNFLIDATYGSSTYEDIDTANVYNVYRTQTGIITRVEPRTVAVPGEPLPVEVTRACATEAPLWERVTTWTDDRVVTALRVLP